MNDAFEDGEITIPPLSETYRMFFQTDPVEVRVPLGMVLFEVLEFPVRKFDFHLDGGVFEINSPDDWMNFDNNRFDLLFTLLCRSLPRRHNYSNFRAEAFLNVLSTKLYTIGDAGEYRKNVGTAELSTPMFSKFQGSGRYLFVQFDPEKVTF